MTAQAHFVFFAVEEIFRVLSDCAALNPDPDSGKRRCTSGQFRGDLHCERSNHKDDSTHCPVALLQFHFFCFCREPYFLQEDRNQDQTSKTIMKTKCELSPYSIATQPEDQPPKKICAVDHCVQVPFTLSTEHTGHREMHKLVLNV